jgi:hypothetical protein
VGSGGTKCGELGMSGGVSVGEGGSENSRKADGGDGKNIFRRVETAGTVSGGLGAGGVSNVDDVGGANLRGKGDGRNIFRRRETAGIVSGLGAGGALNVGSVGNNDFGRSDKGTRFLSVAESVNAGSKQDRGSAGKMGDAGEGQAAMEQASVVKSRGSGGVGDDSTDEGAMSTLSPCSPGVGITRDKEIRGATGGVTGGKERASGMSSRAGKGNMSSEAEAAQAFWSDGGDGRGDESKIRGRGTAGKGR